MTSRVLHRHQCERYFTQPEQLLTGKPIISCSLVALPTELLLRIFQMLDTIDAVCLALASRELLKVSSMLRIKVPSVARHRNLLPSACNRIYQLIWRFEPLCDRRIYHRKKKFKLCADCLQYRPKTKSHWRLLAARYKRTRGVSGRLWKHFVDQWARSSAQCPECYCKEKYPVTDNL
ncbi:hypothetical protein BB8028_0002g14160 [Beauveria bassiana]|uniref:F-box domain-containing protein n=1 Tax=Beauveria bassiana TaxID=176275 RepID=A0A2S7Y4J3_BEABA|nr:hypothetical protein BB8028_0002g14160 [Beauveria bassiana]